MKQNEQKDDEYIKYIKKWLVQNRHKFPYRPYLKREQKNQQYILKFSSIPNIVGYIKNDGCFDFWINITFNNHQFVDNIFDISSIIKKDRKGYYCALCSEKKYKRQKITLWDEHFQWLIQWTNEYLKPSNIIQLELLHYKDDTTEGSYAIKIINKHSPVEKPNCKYSYSSLVSEVLE